MSAVWSISLLLVAIVEISSSAWQDGCDFSNALPFANRQRYINACKQVTNGNCPTVSVVDCEPLINAAKIDRNAVDDAVDHQNEDVQPRQPIWLSCCKTASKLRVEQDIERGYFDTKVTYNNNQDRNKRLTLLKYQRVTNQNSESHKMYAIKLDENKIGTILSANAGTTLFELDGQLNRRGSSNKKQQEKVDEAGLLTEKRRTAADKFVYTGRVDSRRKINDGQRKNKDRPYSRVGVVSMSVESNKWDQCTGTIVGPKWVITAAHCLYIKDPHSQRKHFVTSIIDLKFYPFFNGEVADVDTDGRPKYKYTTPKSFRATAVYIPYGYILDVDAELSMDERAKNDIALIEMGDNMDLGYLAFGYIPNNRLRPMINDDNDHIVTIGYPSDKHNDFVKVRTQDANFKNSYVMHAGLVMDKANVKQIVNKALTNTDIAATQIEANKIIDNKYRGFKGQSGSSIFRWFPASTNPQMTRQYVSIAIFSGARQAKEPGDTNTVTKRKDKFILARYCRITYFKAKLFNDIINGQTDVIAGGATELTAARMDYDNDLYDLYDFFDEQDIVKNVKFESVLMVGILMEVLICIFCVCMLAGIGAGCLYLNRNIIKVQLNIDTENV